MTDGAADSVFGVAITLVLTLVMGIEREEVGRERAYFLGGVRTIPLIGLIGYTLALLAPGNPLPSALGILAIAPFLVVSYQHKLRQGMQGVTTEMTALAAYGVGTLVASHRTPAACALTVATVLLLTGKQPLRQFAVALPRYEITTFVTFLLLAGVILPVLPNESFTAFHLNPFKTWLIVVAVSAISYASYVLQKLTRSENSLILSAALGGAYSSTATTVALARRSRSARGLRGFAGGIVLATGVMYLRLALLLWAFSPPLAAQVWRTLLTLAVIGGVTGVGLALIRRPRAVPPLPEDLDVTHPLEVRAAGLFAALFLGLSVVTQLATQHLGDTGLLALAVVVGATDIDPFVLSLAETAGTGVPVDLAAYGVLAAIASNNVMKGLFALAFGDRRTGSLALAGLTALAALTLAAAWAGI